MYDWSYSFFFKIEALQNKESQDFKELNPMVLKHTPETICLDQKYPNSEHKFIHK